MPILFNNDEGYNEQVGRLKIRAVREHWQHWRMNNQTSSWILIVMQIKLNTKKMDVNAI